MNATLFKGALVVVLASVLSAYADPEVKRLKINALSLDELFKKTPITALVDELAGVLQIDKKTLEKAVAQQKQSLSNVALAKFLASKTSQSVEAVLPDSAEPPWPALFEAAKVSLADANDYLDELLAEVSFLVMDSPQKKKKKK